MIKKENFKMNNHRRQFCKIGGIYLLGSWITGNPLAFATQAPTSIKEILENDSEETLLARMIFGETGGCTLLEKVYAGKTPFNRLHDGRTYTGKGSLKKVLLHPEQYSCFDSTETNRKNLRRILDLPKKLLDSSKELKDWKENLIIAKGLIRGDWGNYNFGQTHFYKKHLVPKLKEGKLKIDPKRLEPIYSGGFKHQFYKEI